MAYFKWKSPNSSLQFVYFVSNQLHVVHFDKKYGSFEEALDKTRGLAVLGYFFKVTVTVTSFFCVVIMSISFGYRT